MGRRPATSHCSGRDEVWRDRNGRLPSLCLAPGTWLEGICNLDALRDYMSEQHMLKIRTVWNSKSASGSTHPAEVNFSQRENVLTTEKNFCCRKEADVHGLVDTKPLTGRRQRVMRGACSCDCRWIHYNVTLGQSLSTKLKICMYPTTTANRGEANLWGKQNGC